MAEEIEAPYGYSSHSDLGFALAAKYFEDNLELHSPSFGTEAVVAAAAVLVPVVVAVQAQDQVLGALEPYKAGAFHYLQGVPP